MKIREKITFVFNCYDFDESGNVTIDELTLSMKSTLTGLVKLTKDSSCPSEASLEEVSMKAFAHAGKHMEMQISLSEFIAFCEATPEIVEWLVIMMIQGRMQGWRSTKLVASSRSTNTFRLQGNVHTMNENARIIRLNIESDRLCMLSEDLTTSTVRTIVRGEKRRQE